MHQAYYYSLVEDLRILNNYLGIATLYTHDNLNMCFSSLCNTVIVRSYDWFHMGGWKTKDLGFKSILMKGECFSTTEIALWNLTQTHVLKAVLVACI